MSRFVHSVVCDGAPTEPPPVTDTLVFLVAVALVGVGVGLALSLGWGLASAGAAILADAWMPSPPAAPRRDGAS